MHRNICVLIFLFFNISQLSFAQVDEQLTKKQIDFLAKIYLEQGNYDGLIRLKPYLKHSANLNQIGLLGIAEFYTKNYKNAEKYLAKALKANPHNELYQELYFYSLLNRGYYTEAQYQINKMENGLKKRIQALYFSKFFHSAFLEGGIKFLKQKELGQKLNYYSGGMHHQLGNSAQLSWAVNSLAQQLNLADINQTELFANTSISLGNGWATIPSFHTINSKYKNATSNLGYNNQLFLTQLNLKKRVGDFTIQPSVALHIEQIRDINNSITQKKQTLQTGATLNYNTKLSKQIHYTITPSYYAIKSNEQNSSLGYGFDVTNRFYLNNWQLFATYLSKDADLYATNEGRFYYNANNNINNRVSLSLGKNIHKQFNILATTQLEKQTNKQNQTLNYNSYFLTLNYNFK